MDIEVSEIPQEADFGIPQLTQLILVAGRTLLREYVFAGALRTPFIRHFFRAVQANTYKCTEEECREVKATRMRGLSCLVEAQNYKPKNEDWQEDQQDAENGPVQKANSAVRSDDDDWRRVRSIT